MLNRSLDEAVAKYCAAELLTQVLPAQQCVTSCKLASAGGGLQSKLPNRCHAK